MKIRTMIGVGITVALFGVATFVNVNSSGTFLALGLNEQGDFLAGFIAPLALVWLVIGYLQQGEELEKNTEALQEQKNEFKQQNISIKKQLFENTLFNLLKLHNDTTQSVKFKTNQGVLEGREAIIQNLAVFIVDLHSSHNPLPLRDESFSDEYGYYKIEPQFIYKIDNNASLAELNLIYLNFYKKFHNYIGHYFRNMYLILKYIDTSDFEDDSYKKFYTNLLRAQLSSEELLFLFYNCAVVQVMRNLSH